MSYILDALKRSEQERHQGDLNHTVIEPILLPPKTKHHVWWPYVLIAVLLINIGVYLYFNIGYDSAERMQHQVIQEEQTMPLLSKPAEIHSSTPQSPQESTSTASQARQASGAEEEAENPLSKPLPVHVLQTPKLDRRFELPLANSTNSLQGAGALEIEKSEEQGSELPEKPVVYNDEGFEVIRPKHHSAASQANQNPLPVERPSVPVETQLKVPENFELIEPSRSSAALSGNQSAGKPLPEKTETVQAQGVQDALGSTPHLSDLDSSFQRNVPALRFNSHIYSENPAQRRVIINDLYLKEGETLAGMVIAMIGEFYIVLEKEGRQFKIPVLRDWVPPR